MPSTIDGVALNDFQHLLATIQHETPLGEFEHIIDAREYPLTKYLFGEARRKIGAGTLIEHDVVFQQAGTMRFVKPGEDCPFSNSENMMKVRQGWSISNHNMWYEEREIKANSAGKNGARRIQDLFKSKRQQNIIIPWLDGWEAALVDTPDSATDDRRPHGFPAWVSLPPTSQAANTVGFNGASITYKDGSTSTTIGGIDTSDSRTRGLWKNLTGTVNKWGDQQCLAIMRETWKRGRFKKPAKATNVNENPFDQTIILVGTDLWLELATLAEARMEAKKNDLTAFEGDLKFMGIPIIDVPTMEYSSTHPIFKWRPMYWLNLRSFMVWTYEGEFMRESEPMRVSSTKHRTWGIQSDTQANTFCINRRHQACISLKTS